MKEIVLLLLLFTNIGISAQNKEAILLLRDGTELKGFASISNQNTILFKREKNDNKTIYNYKTVSKINIKEGNINKVYEYKVILGEQKVLLLEVLNKGRVILYRVLTFIKVPYTERYSSTSNYYVSKENHDIAINFGSRYFLSKKYKKIAVKYFEDCPSLVKEIQYKKLRRRSVFQIINSYNNECK